jgi:hypothetical protein
VLAVFLQAGCGGGGHHSGTQLFITTSSTLPAGSTNTSYLVNLAAAGTDQPFVWLLEQGSQLPPGISLNSGGTLSGIPVTAGTFNFTLTLQGADGRQTSEAFSLTVTVGPPAVTTGSALPSGFTGVAYSVTFAATGGAAPYTWSLTNGSTFPPGITNLDAATGTLSGTPTTGGTFGFSMTVTGNNSASLSQNFTVTITQLAPGKLYVDSNDGQTTGTNLNRTWRFQPADTLTGNVAASVTLSAIANRTTSPACYLFSDEPNDLLWMTFGKVSTPGGVQSISGASTGTPAFNGAFGDTRQHSPTGITLDITRDMCYVIEDSGTPAIFVFKTAHSLSGTVAADVVVPISTTTDVEGAFVDSGHDSLYLADEAKGRVLIFDSASALTTTSVPTRFLTGDLTTAFINPRSVVLDTTRDILYVGDVATGTIFAFDNASTINGTATAREISDSTLGGFFDFTVHPQRDEIYVANDNPPSILVYSPASTLHGTVSANRTVNSDVFSEATGDTNFPAFVPNAIAIDKTR